MFAAYQGPHFMIGIHSIGLQEVFAKRAGPEHDIQYVFDQPQLEWLERSPPGLWGKFSGSCYQLRCQSDPHVSNSVFC